MCYAAEIIRVLRVACGELMSNVQPARGACMSRRGGYRRL